MKIITVPADVKVKDQAGNEKDFAFKDALKAHLDSYVELKTVSQVREASKIIDKIDASNGTISLEDAEYAIVKAACAKVIYIPFITRHLLSFYDAVEGATGA
jgi:SHS2 domain-containing protein